MLLASTGGKLTGAAKPVLYTHVRQWKQLKVANQLIIALPSIAF